MFSGGPRLEKYRYNIFIKLLRPIIAYVNRNMDIKTDRFGEIMFISFFFYFFISISTIIYEQRKIFVFFYLLKMYQDKDKL